MAGTIVASTLSDGTTTSSVTDAVKGSARAWVNFNGVTTATIRASYNVSSVTRNGTGDYTINFTTALADANYAVSFSAEAVTALNRYAYISDSTAPTTTALRVTVIQGGGGVADSARIGVTIFR